MNIAIILAVSDYGSNENNLPGSKKDGEIIHGLLTATNKYDKILTLNENESSLKTKEVLSNFIVENNGLNINEVFFYYSGHGEFINDEFYYLLSDFNNKRRNQTSLQNSEVDDLIRTINPKLLIKVIDACQSGANYIKESDIISKYFNETKKGFDKCYFLNSSLSNQSSYQDENLSFFTNSFVQSLKEHPSNEIRYKDIIDFILDDFDGIDEQTPFFVIQADLTEKFCAFNKEVREYLKDFMIQKKASDKKKNDDKKVPTLIEIVKNNAKEYVDKEGAIGAMEFCKAEFNKLSLDDEIKELYDVKVDFIDENNSLNGVKAIGKWLVDNKHEFFAKPYYEEHFNEYDGEVYTQLVGYEFLVEDAPYNSITIDIIGKYPNLKSYKCNIALLISKKQLTFFYSILQYVQDGWESRTLNKEKISWKYIDRKIGVKESICNGLESIFLAITEKIKSNLYKELGLSSEEESDDEDYDDLPF
tara:strand:+ start:35 stop:1459 length:1425 start_codon:yes stop_codon:yes gene_type:complete